MGKPYDVSLKVLIEAHLPDWLALVPRVPRGRVRVIDSDLATITAEADKVVLVDDPRPWLLHLELQVGYDPHLAGRIAWYNALLSYKHGCPVHSLVVLLTRKADSPGLTGELLDRIGDEPPYRVFKYQVVRAWELDAETLAAGGWGLFPLAPLCDSASPPTLSTLVDQMGRRLVHDHPDRTEARTLAVVMDIFLGLRYDRDVTRLMMEKVMNMIDLRESHAYQIILEQGKAEATLDTLRATVLRLGTKKFGKPPAKVVRAVRNLDDEKRLVELSDRIFDVGSWKELLA